MKPLCLVFLILLLIPDISCFAQQDEQKVYGQVPAEYFSKISKKADAVNERIHSTSDKALQRFQKLQNRIIKRLHRKDSTAANNLLASSQQKYDELKGKLENPQRAAEYIPLLDTIKTSLQFFKSNKGYLSKVKEAEGQLDKSFSKVNELENELQKAEEVQSYLRQQRELLRQRLENFGYVKQFKKLSKDVYYYSQRVNEYKQLLKDPKKIERKAIDLISRTKVFQDFMKKNSLLASLFRMPSDDVSDPAFQQSIAGLQTRAQVNQLIQGQLGTNNPNAMQQLQSNVQQAQSQLQQLRDKVAQYGNKATDQDLPDFKPNNQKTKTFLQRLEYGTNMQSQKGNGVLPVTSDIGVSAGYKLNDKSVIGVGASYKMGWGKDIKHIQISHQGVGIRSFVDVRLKKSFWLSGGYEMNYHSEFNSIEELKQYSAWQQSGLIGLSKKFSINTKFFKNTKLQLLWDFLSYQQVPRAQPIVFRVGYNF